MIRTYNELGLNIKVFDHSNMYKNLRYFLECTRRRTLLCLNILITFGLDKFDRPIHRTEQHVSFGKKFLDF